MTATGRRLTAAALCTAGAALAYRLAVGTGTGQLLENRAIDGRPVPRSWVPDPAADRIAVLVTMSVVAAVVGVLIWIARTGPRARALAAATIVAVPVGLAELLKYRLLDRPRLAHVGAPAYLLPATFPSGHISGACAVAVVAVLVAPARRRAAVALAGAAGASAAGLAMLRSELHRPSDEVAACLIVAAVALVVVAARPGTARAAPGHPLAGPGFATASRVLAAVAAVAATVVVAGLPALLPGAADGGLSGAEYPLVRAVGAAAVVATVCLVVALVGRLVPAGWVAGPRTSDRGETVRGADGAGPPAPYVANRADEGSARCAEQLSSPVAAGGSGGRSPNGSPPAAGT